MIYLHRSDYYNGKRVVRTGEDGPLIIYPCQITFHPNFSSHYRAFRPVFTSSTKMLQVAFISPSANLLCSVNAIPVIRPAYLLYPHKVLQQSQSQTKILLLGYSDSHAVSFRLLLNRCYLSQYICLLTILCKVNETR